jgi:hypothetical protein
VASGEGLPVPVDIHNDGEINVPRIWSVKQLSEHLSKNPALKDVQEVFVQHKLAADIIEDMDLNAIAQWLPMSALQKIAFTNEGDHCAAQDH